MFYNSSSSSEGKHCFHAADIGLVDTGFPAQLTLTLAGFLRQNMTTVGLTALEAIRSFAKSLRRGLLGFHLGHVRLLILWPCSQARPRDMTSLELTATGGRLAG
jgi:hypothetical protein